MGILVAAILTQATSTFWKLNKNIHVNVEQLNVFYQWRLTFYAMLLQQTELFFASF